MNSFQSSPNSGFTTVELLVTLVIGVMFIAVGYELYSIVTRDGAASRDRSVASSLAAIELTKEAAKPATCSTSPGSPTNLPAPTDTPLVEPQITSLTTWPYGCSDSNKIKKVQITITYGEPGERKEVHHGRFVET
jgi:Tfp pilus assembly protein FimT